jgi:hypothetical protein
LLNPLRDWDPTPTTDGPFEVRVSVNEGLDLSKVRAGLFAFDSEAEYRALDGSTSWELDSFDVLASRKGKAKLTSMPSDLESISFVPEIEYELDADGNFVATLPELAEPDAAYRIVVWYDADNDGMMDLTLRGPSEFARTPGRIFPENEGREMFLSSIDREEIIEAGGGAWRAEAIGASTGDDGETLYHNNLIADRELTDWTVEILTETVPNG